MSYYHLLAVIAVTGVPILATAPAVMPAGQAVASTSQVAWHWGAFTGDANSADRDTKLSPAPVSIPDPNPVIQVGSSNSTEYALLADGTVWAWGQGADGQLGNGTTNNSLNTPVRVRFPHGVSIAFLATDAMPFDTALAVDTQGNAWGWGLNQNGELCLGNTRQYDRPVKLPLTQVTTLAGASGHAVYDSHGTVYSCGANGSGVSGTGSTSSRGSKVPVRVKGLNGLTITKLVSAFQNAGALTSTGAYYDWGLNAEGQLGDGSTTASPVPVRVQFPDPSPVVGVAEGGSTPGNGQTMVRLADGTLYAWGDNSYGQILGATSSAQTTPLRFTAPPGVTFVSLASGGGTNYAIDSSGHVWAWGENNYGQVGDGSTENAPAPVRVLSGVSFISSTARDVVAG
jgi:alpha-tubulin suppressor-like RCC1 family protein